MAIAGKPCQCTDSGHGGAPVHEQLRLSVSHRQHDFLALLIGRELGKLNANGSDRPDGAFTAQAHGAVGRLDEPVERRLEARDRRFVPALVNRRVRANEDALLACNVAFGRCDDVPLTGAREAGDARLDPAERPRVGDLVRRQPTWGSISP
jgi:hypothetical protein